MKATFWLYWEGRPIAAVHADEHMTPNEVRGQAVAQHERNPTVYADYPHVLPFEHAARLRFANVWKEGDSPSPLQAEITTDMIRLAKPHALLGVGEYLPRGKATLFRWVAVRGSADDWAVYVGPKDWTANQIRDRGDKVFPRSRDWPNNINATDMALGRYRA